MNIHMNAKAVCKAYGSRLATYDEVEKAYNEGGNGVIMDGQINNWLFLLKKKHIINYKNIKVMKTIVKTHKWWLYCKS